MPTRAWAIPEPGRSTGEPHAYFGWIGSESAGVLEEEDRPAERARAAFSDEGLLLEVFSLRAWSYRASYLQTTTDLEVFRDFCTQDGTIWSPELLLKADSPSHSPLRRMAEAHLARDHARQVEADAEARARYSASGYELFRAGFQALDEGLGRWKRGEPWPQPW